MFNGDSGIVVSHISTIFVYLLYFRSFWLYPTRNVLLIFRAKCCGRICIAEFKQKPKFAVHRNEAPYYLVYAVSDFVIFGGIILSTALMITKKWMLLKYGKVFCNWHGDFLLLSIYMGTFVMNYLRPLLVFLICSLCTGSLHAFFD